MIPAITPTEERQHKKRAKVAKVPTVNAALDYTMNGLQQDIKSILGSGISGASLARGLGIHPVTLYRWQAGLFHPRELLITLTIMRWAEQIRTQQQNQLAEVS